MMRRMMNGLALAAAVFGIGGTSASAGIVYGITDDGRIAKVDLVNKTETFLTGAQGANGNGVALDLAGNRLLYRLNSSEKGLHALNLSDNTITTTAIAGLPGESASAAYYDNAYWYIAQNTNDLYKVTGSTFTKVADINSGSLNFGDIVITPGGELYGSAATGFFRVDLSNPTGSYQVLNAGMPQLQLALLLDGSIVGQNHNNGEWYNITLSGSTASYSALGYRSTALRDIAGTAVPEPASLAMMGIGGLAALAFARRRARTAA